MGTNDAEPNETKRNGHRDVRARRRGGDASRAEPPAESASSGEANRRRRAAVGDGDVGADFPTIATFEVWHDRDGRLHGLLEVGDLDRSRYRIEEAVVVLSAGGDERGRIESGDDWQSWYDRTDDVATRWTEHLVVELETDAVGRPPDADGYCSVRIADAETGRTERYVRRRRAPPERYSVEEAPTGSDESNRRSPESGESNRRPS
ncbi:MULTISPECIES: hypothetical protein [Halorussus]|uniref:hypothetical protein n=1 Tax=Halorussus TaxID=1070314 RepID=UPI0020A20767|nr:hypothetical protein [Halorussus vallis]USZ74924.1 hypothetical protein NGM07_15975 [Halorussus vallis]